MKTIIIQYKEDSDLDKYILQTLAIEYSSKVSLAKRSILKYCQEVLKKNAKSTGTN